MDLKDAFPKQFIYNMPMAPLPRPCPYAEAAASEVFEEHLRAYKNAFPPSYMNFPVMGVGTVEYRPDDIIVMRPTPITEG